VNSDGRKNVLLLLPETLQLLVLRMEMRPQFGDAPRLHLVHKQLHRRPEQRVQRPLSTDQLGQLLVVAEPGEKGRQGKLQQELQHPLRDLHHPLLLRSQ
jgi:hypothetical protein